MGLHKNSSGVNVHTPITWTYANEAARNAASGFAASDVGKFAWQQSDNTVWMLTDDSPITWAQVGGGGSPSELAFGRVVRTAGDYTVASGGSFVDVDSANVTITLTTGARRCRIVLQATGGNGTGNGSTYIDFTVDGTRVGQSQGLLLITTPTASNNQNLSTQHITDVLSAGSHTFRTQWRATGGTGTIRASTTTTPLVFWVEELNIST